MTEQLTSREQLLIWTGKDQIRENCAAWTEGQVKEIFPLVMPGSEQFYALVLEHVLTTGK